MPARPYVVIPKRAQFKRAAADGRKASCRTMALQYIPVPTIELELVYENRGRKPDFPPHSERNEELAGQLFKKNKYISENTDQLPAIGFTVSRHVGNAVVRNRVKRKLRAVVDIAGAEGTIPSGTMVIIARAGAYEADFKTLARDFRYCLGKL